MKSGDRREPAYRLLVDADPELDLGRVSAELSTDLAGPGAGAWGSACAAAAALALRRPELAAADAFDGLVAALLTHPRADAAACAALVEGLAARGAFAAGHGPRTLSAVLEWRGPIEAAVDLAARLAAWCPGRLTGADVVRLARCVTGQMRSEVFLHSVLERWLWQRPGALPPFTDAQLEDLESAVGSHPRWRQSSELMLRRGPGASAATDDRPPSPSPTVERLVVVQNLDIGQGDEIFRLGPLLAMLLALAPGATFDVVTRRRHLWDHPRIRTVAIDDEAAVRQSLDAADGFAWTDEPAAFGILRLEWLPAAIRGRAARAPWVLEMTTRHTHPVFRRLRLGGVDWLPELRPGSPPRDAYDTLERLALRLGLPWIGDAEGGAIAGDGPATVGAAFIGRASAEAGPAIADLGGDGSRPLAVVQPFGGFTEVKGYTRGEDPRLVRELGALVDEGFRVVILPVVEAWGRADRVRELVGRLAPPQARHVAVAPDPAAPPAWLGERPELAGADRVLRFFKYLVARADLVVAVEGWVCHLGSLLGRPVRVVLRAGSFTPDWYPRGASWSAALSAGCGPDRPDVLASGSKAPVLSLPDRGLLGVALAGLMAATSLSTAAIADELVIGVRSG
ncbi:MAG: hypothetical protein AAFX50_06260, partial [Acidobacteriota bacterium]